MQSKKAILNGLENLCAQLEIKLRYEKTSAKGGLCKHEGQLIIIIDKKSSDEFKINTIAKELKAFDLSGIFISPRLRDILEQI